LFARTIFKIKCYLPENDWVNNQYPKCGSVARVILHPCVCVGTSFVSNELCYDNLLLAMLGTVIQNSQNITQFRILILPSCFLVTSAQHCHFANSHKTFNDTRFWYDGTGTARRTGTGYLYVIPTSLTLCLREFLELLFI